MRADFESELSESCGCVGKFLPLAELHSLFQEKVLPCLPCQSPESSLRCDGGNTSSDFYRSSRVMHWEASCSFPVYYISSSRSGCCQVLNQNGLLVWLIYGWFCIPRLCYSDSQMESHVPQNLHSHPLHPISSYICEDICICSLGGLTLSLQEGLLSCGFCVGPA